MDGGEDGRWEQVKREEKWRVREGKGGKGEEKRGDKREEGGRGREGV